MSDTWNDIQAVKSRQSSLREKRDRLKKLMQDINQSDTDPPENRTDESNAVSLSSTTKATLSVETSKATTSRPGNTSSTSSSSVSSINPTKGEEAHTEINKQVSSIREKLHKRLKKSSAKLDPELIVKLENEIQFKLSDVTLNFPMEGSQLMSLVCKKVCPADVVVPAPVFDDLLHKLSAQQLISLNPLSEAREGESVLLIVSADTTKLGALGSDQKSVTKKRQHESDDEPPNAKQQKTSAEPNKDSVESLLATHTAKERENKKMNEEILQLLSKPSAKEQSLVEKFKSQGGASVQEFCQFGTINECLRSTGKSTPCDKLHFKKIINSHTDESLGDCSFLNTCFHMATCKYVHYEINTADQPSSSNTAKAESNTIAKKSNTSQDGTTVLFPPQWVQCDVRKLDMSVLGKFAVIMADPPWDIHMELPYGTMGDDEMRSLDVPNLQDEGYIFLWVTGRAMELGRECLMLWGYERVDELIWVKTNQLQRIIRTGRTGHWLNHGKEHCLVGVKGEPKNMNRGLDCDVIVAEVRATSHKPDEIYGIIERLSPGTRKLELFGRPHNVQPNWITLGNQLDGVRLLDPDVVGKFKKRYPDGKGLS